MGTSQKNFRQHFRPAPANVVVSRLQSLPSPFRQLPRVRTASFTLAKHIRPAAPTDHCKPLGVVIRHELFISGLTQRLRSSKTYADKPWVMVSAQAIVGQFLMTFKEFPPRQNGDGGAYDVNNDIHCVGPSSRSNTLTVDYPRRATRR
jgi:hypothetical protein